jgi:hypothetical protein
MTKRPSNDAKARAEAVFRKPTETTSASSGDGKTNTSTDGKPTSASRPVETIEGAMEEYLARQDAERANMAKLREQRIAAEAKAASEKTKRKPTAKR